MNSALFAGFTCDRSDAVRTNCPTQLPKLIERVSIRRTHVVNANLPSQECVERKVRHQDTVDELYDAREHEEEQERVDELQSRRRGIIVGF